MGGRVAGTVHDQGTSGISMVIRELAVEKCRGSHKHTAQPFGLFFDTADDMTRNIKAPPHTIILFEGQSIAKNIETLAGGERE